MTKGSFCFSSSFFPFPLFFLFFPLFFGVDGKVTIQAGNVQEMMMTMETKGQYPRRYEEKWNGNGI